MATKRTPNSPARSAGTPPAQPTTTRPQRRGSVTKPVKKGTPWTLLISGALGLVAVIAVVVFVVNQQSNASTASQPSVAGTPRTGAPTPDFSVVAADGTTLTKASIAGKPTLMVFFASWCTHCQAEAPRLKTLAEANPDLQIVLIGADYQEQKDAVHGFQQKFSLPFPTYFDGGKAAGAFGVQSYPTLVAVDKGGNVRAFQGGEQTPEQLTAFANRARM